MTKKQIATPTINGLYDIEKQEDGLVSFIEKGSDKSEYIEPIPATQYSYGLAMVTFGGSGYFDNQNLIKLAASNLEDAKKEAKAANPYGTRATIHLFRDGVEVCALYRPYIRNHRQVISRKWENI